VATPSTFIKSSIAGSIILTDANGVSLTVPFDKGDVAIGPLLQHLNEPVKIEARGHFLTLTRGNRVYPTFNFSCFVGNLIGATAVAPGAVLEFITGTGAYSGNVSVQGANREMTVNARLRIEGTNVGDADDEIVQCANVIFQANFTEAMDGYTLTLAGEVLGSVTITNGTNTVTFAEIS
jgi:hypothetical protein